MKVMIPVAAADRGIKGWVKHQRLDGCYPATLRRQMQRGAALVILLVWVGFEGQQLPERIQIVLCGDVDGWQWEASKTTPPTVLLRVSPRSFFDQRSALKLSSTRKMFAGIRGS